MNRKPSGPHKSAPPDRITRLRNLLAILEPLDVLHDGAVVILGPIVGCKPGQIGPILRGERSIGEARLCRWEQLVEMAAKGGP